ncbi:MAG: hypothetical protein LV473_17015 [Nitrospira sp.]|nr:hypothetical protein [Nitrospira sp.]
MDLAIVEVSENVSVRQRDERWRLLAGDWLVLPLDAAHRLLQEAPGSMRILAKHTIEAENFPPVYWQHGDRIMGPGTVEHATVDAHSVVQLLISHGNEASWIRASSLRTQAQFDQQQRPSRCEGA